MTYASAPHGTHPSNDTPSYLSTRARHPSRPRVAFPQTVTEVSGPRFLQTLFPPTADLTRAGGGEAMGERIIVSGRVLDGSGRPVPHTMLEIWQANSAGRYMHARDQHAAPLDPVFPGSGRVFTDADGVYRFVSIKPGAYPWGNHPNAWRPNHIHFSLFGPAFATRLVTQMYFPGDPLLELDPIFHSIPSEAARARLVSTFDLSLTEPDWALGYRFDIFLRGPDETPFEHHSFTPVD